MRFFSLLLLGMHSLIIHAVIPQKVLICGVCKDVASRLEQSSKIMEDMGDLFQDYRIIVYENNSSDNTVEMLTKWKELNAKVFFKSEFLSKEDLEKVIINRNDDGDFSRPEVIARARNIVLDIVEHKEYDDFKYIIWMDMDFVIYPNLSGIVEAFETDREWDAVLAYGTTLESGGNTWDWYAWRDDNYPIGSELLGMSWWKMYKSIVFSDSSDWYPVYSAFGGCGMYKRSSIIGCRYAGIVTKDLEEVANKIIKLGQATSHPQIRSYFEGVKHLNGLIPLDAPVAFSQKVDPNTGILLKERSLTWRIDVVYGHRYPSVCEHVAFHASMFVNGYTKLFVNPRLKFIYGG